MVADYITRYLTPYTGYNPMICQDNSVFLQILRKTTGLCNDTRGSVSILMAFSITALILASGAALDLGRAQIAKTVMQNASDAAALAGALSPGSDADRKAQAERFFRANWPEGLLKLETPTPNVTANSTSVRVGTQNVQIPTGFMRTKGTYSTGVNSDSEVALPSTIITPVHVTFVTNAYWKTFGDYRKILSKVVEGGTLTENVVTDILEALPQNASYITNITHNEATRVDYDSADYIHPTGGPWYTKKIEFMRDYYDPNTPNGDGKTNHIAEDDGALSTRFFKFGNGANAANALVCASENIDKIKPVIKSETGQDDYVKVLFLIGNGINSAMMASGPDHNNWWESVSKQYKGCYESGIKYLHAAQYEDLQKMMEVFDMPMFAAKIGTDNCGGPFTGGSCTDEVVSRKILADRLMLQTCQDLKDKHVMIISIHLISEQTDVGGNALTRQVTKAMQFWSEDAARAGHQRLPQGAVDPVTGITSKDFFMSPQYIMQTCASDNPTKPGEKLYIQVRDDNNDGFPDGGVQIPNLITSIGKTISRLRIVR